MLIMDTKQLLWIDLEMTGLRPEKDVILEVAAIVTDINLNELATFEAVIKPNTDPTALMDETVLAMHTNNELLERLKAGRPEQAVQDALADFIAENCQQPAVLAGNSIHMDRRFIDHHWPKVSALLHYRMLDVSSFKIWAQAKYGKQFEKGEAHRALGDIRESIAELAFYDSELLK